MIQAGDGCGTYMFPFDIRDLGTGFKRFFEIVPALSAELREHAYRIRHEVYCEELNYEPRRPDRREVDDYDAHSLHCLIRNLQSGGYVGCVRLVLARPGSPAYPLPFEKTCATTIDRAVVDPRALPRHTVAEASRLAVISRYRLRRGEKEQPYSIVDDKSFSGRPMPRFPYIPVALYLATVELAAMHGIETLFVLTEPRLASHFARLGVEIKPIGEAVEHRGTRIPSMMSVSRIIADLNFILRPLYNVVADEVRQGVAAQKAVA
jgi:N-acyl amino acid synthase of PEP-CTERM/exosortase system